MFTCPNCGAKLTRQQNELGVFWGCTACGGWAVSMAVLRKAVQADCVDRAWAAARDGRGTSGRLCPMCDHAMTEVPLAVNDGALKLDVCKLCQFVWFDPGELQSMPPAPEDPRKTREQALPQEAREAIALYEVKKIGERARDEDPCPDAEWKTVPALFGFPVETDSTTLTHLPWFTWLLAAVIATVSISAFKDLKPIVEQYALIPAVAWRYGGMTSLTSFFLHGGVMHLLGNLYFLVMFGNHVEDYLGRWRLALLILLATVGGDVAHVLAQPNSTVPCIGASGGISGVIAFYALEFPHASLSFLGRYGWVQFPAWGAFGLWILMQIVGSIEQIRGFSGVASLAHIGGAAVGILAWLFWRRLGTQSQPQ
jgi:membrane associated rhomboid family serine protease/Zn-finger nucleic acid-binding protein